MTPAQWAAQAIRTGDAQAWGRWVRFCLALVALFVLFAAPADPHAYQWASFVRPPIELAAVLAALAFAPQAWSRILRLALLAALLALLVFRLGDAAFYLVLNRAFDPWLDLPLIKAGWGVLRGSIGTMRAAAAAVAGLVGVMALIAGLYGCLRGLEALRPVRWGRTAAALVAMLHELR